MMEVAAPEIRDEWCLDFVDLDLPVVEWW